MHFDSEQRSLAIAALNTPPPIVLFEEPIEYIFADHFRQRTLCSVLDEIAGMDYPDHDLIRAAVDFLRHDFGLHIEDEENDLFPMLKARLTQDDDVSDVLANLSQEHEQDGIDAQSIQGLLQKYLDDEMVVELNQKSRSLLNRFAENERHHLTTENAILLPIARARLTEADLAEMGRRMAARRESRTTGSAQC